MASCLSTSYPLSRPTNSLSKLSRFNRAISASRSPYHLYQPLPLAIKTKPLNRFHPHPPFLPLPISCTPKNSISCSHNPKHEHKSPTLLRICAEGAAALLVGSLLFIAKYHCRTPLALAGAPSSSTSAALPEETVETPTTQDGKDEGEEMYARILEQNPKDVEALKVVLYGKMKKGRTAEAVQYVERLIVLEPDEVEWRLLQALSYELMGQLAKAKRMFREILKERPLLLRALHGLALAMHKNREGPAVFEMLNKALELACRENKVTEERNIKILIAQMHVVKGNLEGALRQFQDLVDENPRDFRPYLCQGIIYSLLDKKKEAEEQFEIYRNIVPDEFPQRGFIDDVILAAKTESQERLQKEFGSEFSYKK